MAKTSFYMLTTYRKYEPFKNYFKTDFAGKVKSNEPRLQLI